MTQQTESALTPEVKAMIGIAGDTVEAWGVVDAEYLRRFTQAVMDPDPMYWDQEYARNSRYGEITTPPIMVSYLASRIRPDQGDPITRAFEENPESDGIGSVERPGELPPVPTNLQISQYWRQDLLPEPVLGHPGAGGTRRQALPDNHQRDQVLEPER
jgi:hypothetical protein